MINHPDIQINHAADNGVCPLIVAAFIGDLDIVKMLLDAYIEKGLDTKKDVTAIEDAIQLTREVGHSHIVEILEEHLQKIWSPPVMRLSW